MPRMTATNKTRVTPETRAVTKPVSVPEEPKTKKIRMTAVYISAEYNLYKGNEYELPSKLADELIKNNEAVKC